MKAVGRTHTNYFIILILYITFFVMLLKIIDVSFKFSTLLFNHQRIMPLIYPSFQVFDFR